MVTLIVRSLPNPENDDEVRDQRDGFNCRHHEQVRATEVVENGEGDVGIKRTLDNHRDDHARGERPEGEEVGRGCHNNFVSTKKFGIRRWHEGINMKISKLVKTNSLG